MVKLPIPYRSQWDNNDADDYLADCGPTCLAMILNFRGVAMTPNGVYDKIPEPHKHERGVTDFNQLIIGGRGLGVKLNHCTYHDHGQETAFRGLRANLDAGTPSWGELLQIS